MSDEKKTRHDDAAEPKTTPTPESRERKQQENELDTELEDSFPASDPPSSTQPKAD